MLKQFGTEQSWYKLWVRQLDEGKLLNIRAMRTLPIDLKNKDGKKTWKRKLEAKRQIIFIFQLKHLWK